MKTLSSCLSALVVFFVLLPSAACARQDDAISAFEAPLEAWLQDLETINTAVLGDHPRAQRADFQSIWTEAVDTTREAFVSEAPPQRLLRLHRLLARLEDGHSNLVPFYLPTAGFERQLPLRFYLFDEGLYITRTDAAHSELAGARVIAIGGVQAETAVRAVMALVGADNPQWARNWAPVTLRYAAYLAAFGWSDTEAVDLTLAMPDGQQRALRIAFAVAPDTGHSAQRMTPGRFRTDRNYDFTHLADENAVLAIYSAVADMDDESLAAFADRLFDFIEGHEVDRLIIDVRENGGGNNYLNQPWLHRMIGSRVNRPGGIMILTGRSTFSAAMNFVTRAERHTQALIVGEPTGGAPNHYGDPNVQLLPGTGMPVLTSTLFWQDSAPDDARRAIYPDLPVTERFADWVVDRDAALDAALAFDAAGLEASLPGLRWQRESQRSPGAD